MDSRGSGFIHKTWIPGVCGKQRLAVLVDTWEGEKNKVVFETFSQH